MLVFKNTKALTFLGSLDFGRGDHSSSDTLLRLRLIILFEEVLARKDDVA